MTRCMRFASLNQFDPGRRAAQARTARGPSACAYSGGSKRKIDAFALIRDLVQTAEASAKPTLPPQSGRSPNGCRQGPIRRSMAPLAAPGRRKTKMAAEPDAEFQIGLTMSG